MKSSKNANVIGKYEKKKVGNEFCNAAIRDNYSKEKFMLMPSGFMGAFAYYVAVQSPKETFLVNNALNRYYWEIVHPAFNNIEIPQTFTLAQLDELINEERFFKIPAIKILNDLKEAKIADDFIDLGALARNVKYMIARECITQPL